VRERCYAIALEHVVETMRPLPIERVAGAPACVRGVAIVRGAPVPVLDVASLLGDAEAVAPGIEATTSARFVTLKVAARRVALAVDRVIGVRSLGTRSIHGFPPLLGDAHANVIAAIGTLDNELLLVLRNARSFSEDLLDASASPGSP
jgi:purine-binding chemotaxis protein CheW